MLSDVIRDLSVSISQLYFKFESFLAQPSHGGGQMAVCSSRLISYHLRTSPWYLKIASLTQYFWLESQVFLIGLILAMCFSLTS